MEAPRGRLGEALEALRRCRGRMIDAHAHVGPDQRFLMRASPSDVARIYDRYGIRLGLFSSTISLLAGAAEGNRHVLEAAAQLPGRILPLYALNPLEPGALEGLDPSRYVGVKFHPEYFHVRPSHPLSLRALRRVEELGLPLMLHSYDGGVEAAKVASEFPDLVVVAYHMGGLKWRECIDRMSKHGNVMVEVSSSIAEPGMVEAAVGELGSDRVLFGTDIPYLDPAVSLGKVLGAALNAGELEDVLWRNAEKLLRGRRVVRL